MSSQAASLAPVMAVLALVQALAGCAARVPQDRPAVREPVVATQPGAREASLSVGERAAVAAVRQIGVPYRYGGSSRSGFDCSGLVHFAYAKAGLRVPRTTQTLWNAMQPVARRDLRVGDVLFFRISGKMSHVGMYIGKRRFVHAPSTGREVTIAELDSEFYQRAFLRGGRPR